MAAGSLLFLFTLTLSLFTHALSLAENSALLKLKASFDGSDALNSWRPTSVNACVDKWVGVICSNGVVTSLNLKDMALSGTIDIDALREIPSLRIINFANNSFSGPIPGFNELGALKALYLSRNKFTGEIPQDYFSGMSSLKKLWLDNNKFTGKIPESLMKLPHLIEAHLEGNQFSGPIPQLKSSSVTSVDVSNNNLEGEIPDGFSKFGAGAFEGNEKLCGKPLKLCEKPEEKPPPQLPKAASASSSSSHHEQSKQSGGNSSNNLVISAIIIALLLLFIVAAIIYAKRKERTYFSVLEKESNVDNRALEVHVPESNNNRSGSSRKSAGASSRKSEGSMSGKSSKSGRTSGMGDLVMLNEEKGSFGLADLMKAAAEVLGNGGMGSAYKAAMANGLTVVVKRMREINKMSKETFDSEMKRLSTLSHPNILTPLAYHYRREEKLVVSEYMPKGSLLYLLHGDRGICHAQLNWPTRLNIIKGIASGLNYIHSEFSSYELPHGNLKSSNVLLTEQYRPLLNDFAFHPLTNTEHATHSMFAFKSPEYIQDQKISKKSDVYCLGIMILEIITGKFPSQYLTTGKGGIDVVDWVRAALMEDHPEGKEWEKDLIDPDLLMGDTATESMGMMVKLLQIGVNCTQAEPEKRLDIGEVINRIEQVQIK